MSDPKKIVVRSAIPADLKALGVMAANLVRLHFAFDPKRFLLQEPIEEGYARFLGRESTREGALVLTALHDDEIVGYAYGALEDRNWMDLRDACGALHDIFVIEEARRHGVAKALVTAAMEKLKQLGAPRVILKTAAKNSAAQQFFDSMGFRQTMIEMTKEL